MSEETKEQQVTEDTDAQKSNPGINKRVMENLRLRVDIEKLLLERIQNGNSDEKMSLAVRTYGQFVKAALHAGQTDLLTDVSIFVSVLIMIVEKIGEFINSHEGIVILEGCSQILMQQPNKAVRDVGTELAQLVKLARSHAEDQHESEGEEYDEGGAPFETEVAREAEDEMERLRSYLQNLNLETTRDGVEDDLREFDIDSKDKILPEDSNLDVEEDDDDFEL